MAQNIVLDIDESNKSIRKYSSEIMSSSRRRNSPKELEQLLSNCLRFAIVFGGQEHYPIYRYRIRRVKYLYALAIE